MAEETKVFAAKCTQCGDDLYTERYETLGSGLAPDQVHVGTGLIECISVDTMDQYVTRRLAALEIS